MFNMYTKLATALGAFALLFSTGAWGQCADGQTTVNFNLTAGDWPGEISWSLNDADGNNLFTGGAPFADVWCLAPGDYTFLGTDEPYQDGWNGAVATFEANNTLLASFAVEGASGSIVITVPEQSSDVPGCTDAGANNYNADATVDDGSCCFANLMTFTLFDSFSDGWSIPEGLYGLPYTFGGLIINGDSIEFAGGASLTYTACLDTGCYTAQLAVPYFSSEGTFQVADADGNIINSGAASGSGPTAGGELFFFAGSDACVVLGCTDEVACNYDEGANSNDGTCEYLTCAGCTDPTACNYDELATLENNTCDFSCVGCLDPTALNYCADCTVPGECAFCEGAFAGTLSVGGGTYDGEISWSLVIGDSTVAEGFAPTTVDLCLSPDCYQFNMADSWGDGWNGASYSFTTYEGTVAFSGDINNAQFVVLDAGSTTGGDIGYDVLEIGGTCSFGCADASACNYDETAQYDDGSCDYSCQGCTDSSAANYDPEATIDSGDCIFCEPGTFFLTVDMTDAAGDGWDGAEYVIFTDELGNLYEGSLDSAFTGDGLSSGSDNVCLAPGCYTFQVSAGSWPEEIGVTLSDQFGTVYGSIGAPATYGIDFTLTGQCSFEGCTDVMANNFNPSASIDDGSCQSPPANDLAENAEALACGLSVAGSSLYANDEGFAGIAYGNYLLGGVDVWYVINSDADQQITVTTCGTPAASFDNDYAPVAALSIFTQDLDGNLSPIATNIFGCDDSSLSTISWTASTGQDYYVRVEAVNGTDFVVSATCNTDQSTSPSNDDCEGAISMTSGQTITQSLCGANAEELFIPGADQATPYAVYFSINNGDFDSWYIDAVNVGNDVLGWGILDGNNCDDFTYLAGASATGQIAFTLSNLVLLEDSADTYFVIWTEDQESCGEFEYTVTGVYLGCTDPAANNYDAQATEDDQSCDYTDVTPSNDTCGDAIALACDTIVTGSTGGSTAVDAPNGACELAPGAGVWFSLVGDGSIHTLSTCGSTIDSKINVLSADTVCGQYTCVDAANASDGNGVCTLFDDDDVNITFISEPGVQYYVYLVAEDADGNPLTNDNGTYELTLSCEAVLEGCTDPGACNYNEAANVEDGSCEIISCVCPDSTGNPLQFYMEDSFGDGWNGAFYTISDVNGNEVATGSLEEALVSEDNDNFSGADFGYDLFCLEDGCYIISVDGGIFPSEVSWELRNTDGTVIVSGVPTDGISLSLGGAVCGCTDSGACNYNADATSEDGSCEYETCAGCSDSTACNYEPGATINDGSCCFENCLDVNLFDSFGDGWNGAEYILSSVDGTVIGSGTIEAGNNASDTYCLADGCYTIEVSEGSYPGEVSWEIDGNFAGIVAGGAGESATFNVGSGDNCVEGCDIACACNYNPDINIANVALCEFDGCSGCTYEGAPQYDETATTDDGSCTFEFANPCPADLNGDGSVSTADLLEFLTAFGQICE